MPYKRAHFVLAGIFLVVVAAFWPSYFSRLGEGPAAIHAHGMTATAWVVMLVFQSWAIHNRRTALHRAVGKSSFALFPLFMAGGLVALHAMARGVAAGGNPFQDAFGAGLGALDIVAIGTFAVLYHGALRNVRRVQLHARYMMATLLMLSAPTLTRLFIFYVPGLRIAGPGDFGHFGFALHLSGAVGLLIALALYRASPGHGRPFLLAGMAVVLQSAAYQWLGSADWWRAFYGWLGSMPAVVPLVVGLGLGALIVWRGLGGQGGRAGPRVAVEPARG